MSCWKKFFCVRLNFSRVVIVHRHEGDSFFNLSKLNPVLFSRPLDLTKQLHLSVYFASKLQLLEDIHEFCQDKVPNQSTRVPLLSTV